ncbi:MoaD/ThiS family protein [Caldivirga maquilingensis]|uniref:MoaD family protein n=1 Tax=Caldivirga maquilingensis (strain ATCC 700844 / DSM 13496 / JCM 10307 / IC-167) TaxID=397948 RepID=A8MAQ8_CALMQ|nr:MoaD family protein [Caldivirga maquilingensis]ABW01094.1 MoaD family protein [Caldivirga maquilingensis IC-167]
MKVTVKFLALFYEMAKTLRMELNVPDGISVRDLLKIIDEKVNPNISKTLLSDDSGLREGYNILVNGRAIDYVKGLDTVLKDGDEVVLLPPIDGG